MVEGQTSQGFLDLPSGALKRDVTSSNEGFCERFPAKGQVERVRVFEQRLLREMDV